MCIIFDRKIKRIRSGGGKEAEGKIPDAEA
jgi:hypothetical protein